MLDFRKGVIVILRFCRGAEIVMTRGTFPATTMWFQSEISTERAEVRHDNKQTQAEGKDRGVHLCREGSFP